MRSAALHLFAVAALLGGAFASKAANEETSRTQRQAGWYYPSTQNWPFIYNYPGEDEAYYVRSLLKRPAVSYGYPSNAIKLDEKDAESRLGFGLFNGNLLTNTRPAALLNNLPFIRNPNFPSLIASSFDSCKATTGEMGICAPGFACSAYGGRPSGSCNLGTVCCINVVSSCSSQITLNNTYWETPSTAITRPTSCSLTVKVDQRLLEQKRPICQVRLDFSSFTIEQPEDTSVCVKDVFRVDGATNSVPEICGDNAEQHMYINVPNSGTTATNLQLVFSFGRAGTVTPSWKIKVALLPCGADYLAPDNCLQYFSSAAGTVKSFNWKDDDTKIRQLANQNYRACFRNELIDGKSAKTICLTACSANGFSLSGDQGTPEAKVGTTNCAADYLLFLAGTKKDSTEVADRFCGGALHTTDDEKASTTVCSDMKPFALTYGTNAEEPTGARRKRSVRQETDPETDPEPEPEAESAKDVNNLGFCLKFQQSA